MGMCLFINFVVIDFVESIKQVYSAQIGRIASLYVLIDDVSSSKYSVSTS